VADFDQRARNAGAPSKGAQATEPAQLRKLPHEFDVLGEGQLLQLLTRRPVWQRHSDQIVAALQNEKTVCCHSAESYFRR
jgi:hypothetical protein